MNPQNLLFTADASQSINWEDISAAYTSGITGVPSSVPEDTRGIIEKTGDFVAGIPKWTALSAGSAIIGLANTVPLVANAVGGQGTMEYLSTLKFAQSLDESFATGTSMADFYNAHSEGIELTGAIAGSIIPGTLAVKGARIAANGLTPFVSRMAAIESDHIVGRSAAWLGGLVETSTKTRILRNSYESLIKGSSNITNLMPLDRLKFALSSGVQLGAEAMVFEAGATLAQMSNPTYKDIDDLSSFTSHIVTAGAFGGALGGLVSPLLWKSAKFMPSEGATELTTLRDTAQKMGEARQKTLQIMDFGQQLKSIAPGSKISSLVDDLGVTKEELMRNVQDFADFAPADRKDTVLKTIEEWVTRRDSTIEATLKQELVTLTKAAGIKSDIGATFFSNVIRDKDGNILLDGDSAAQIMDGATSLGAVRFKVTSTGISVPPTAQFSDEVLANYSSALYNTVPGKILYTLESSMANLRNQARNEGFKLNAANKNLTDAQIAIKNQYNELRAKANHADFKTIKALLDDPRNFNDAAAQYLKMTPGEAKALAELVRTDTIGTKAQYYDMLAKQFVDRPAVTLGDIVTHKDNLKVIGSVIQAEKQILTRDFRATISKSSAPTDSLTAQINWTLADATLSKKSGNTLQYGKQADDAFFKEGEYNPFRLAAAIDRDIELPISREQALGELTKGKMKLYGSAKQRGMSEVEARMYADLPLEDDLINWTAQKGRENNFLTRRNVRIEYREAAALSELELKTIAGVRANIVTRQLELAENTISLAKDIGIDIPPIVVNKLAQLREIGINGGNPIDMANAANAGAITNATGRMLRMNTDVLQLGTYVNHLISRQADKITRELSAEFQSILRGAGKKEELDLLRTVHNKITGGGNKWYDLSHYVDEAPDTLTYVSRDVIKLLRSGKKADIAIAEDMISSGNTKHVFTVENENLARLLIKYSSLESQYRKLNINILGAKGYNVADFNPGELYFPPLDVKRSPYFALVRSDADSAVGGLSRYSFVHANTSANLAKKVSLIEQQLGNKVKIFSKEQVETDKMLAGEFEQAKSFYSYSIDSELHSKGVFSDVLPRSGEDLLEEMQTHLRRSATNSVRHIISSASGDFLNSLDRLSTTLDEFTKSTHGKAFGPGKRGVTPDNIYSQMQRSMLDIRPDENAAGILGLATRVQNQVVEWTDSLYDAGRNMAIRASVNQPQKLPELQRRVDAIVAESARIGANYTEMTAPILMEAEERFGRGYATQAFTQTLNGISAMLTLGVDFTNMIVQSISLPVTINSAIRQLLADAPPQVRDQIKSLGLSWKSALLLAKAGKDFWGDVLNVGLYQIEQSGKALKPEQLAKLTAWKATDNGRFFTEMSELGLIPPSTRQFMIELGETTNLKDVTLDGLRAKLVKASELATIGNRYSEMFQRYSALKVADGIATAAGLTGANKLNLLHSFATQANGVFTAAQRPGLFQGAIGSAFGLYKSYAINLMQALGRHIENRDTKSLLVLAAVQGSIFGARSIPGAEQLNAYIMAQNIEHERDLYTTAEMIMGKGVGNAFLYGLPSMFLNSNLYSRGDLRPASLVGNPLDVASFPALNQFTNAIGVVSNAMTKAANGAPIGASILDAVAHQSLWRPAARVAEYALGAQTTKQGEVIQNVGEMSAPIFGLNLAVRLAGSRPYDEAVLSDSYYRRLQYKSAETQAMKGLNAAVRLSIQQGRELDYDSLAEDYVQKGGDPRKFRNWIRRHQSRMNITEAERMKQQLLKSDNVRFAQQLDIPDDDF